MVAERQAGTDAGAGRLRLIVGVALPQSHLGVSSGMEIIFYIALPVLAIALANGWPVDEAMREHDGALHRRSWHDIAAMGVSLICSVLALCLCTWLFILLQPSFEYGPALPAYFTLLGAPLGVLTIYLGLLCVAGRSMLRLYWSEAWRMAARAAMCNALVLLGTVVFFAPSFIKAC